MPKKITKKQSKKKESQNALKIEVEQLRAALSASMAAIAIVNSKKTITFINTRWLSFFNYVSPSELLGKQIFELFPDPEQHKLLKGLFSTVRMAVPVSREIKGRKSDGSDVFLLARIRKSTSQGNVFYTLTALDVSDRKAMEIELRESKAMFESAFINAPIGLALVSPDGKFVRVNKRLSVITGYPEDSLVKKTFQDITHPDDLEKDLKYVTKMLEGKISTYEIEKRYIRKDKNTVWVQLNVSTIKDAEGKIKFFVSQIQDISYEKKHAKEIEDRQKELEKMNKFMIGRELRMRELKREIRELKKGT